jgi:hypothetical protein
MGMEVTVPSSPYIPVTAVPVVEMLEKDPGEIGEKLYDAADCE